jgi:hypothetical protein
VYTYAGNVLIFRYNLVMYNNKEHCGAPFQVTSVMSLRIHACGTCNTACHMQHCTSHATLHVKRLHVTRHTATHSYVCLQPTGALSTGALSTGALSTAYNTFAVQHYTCRATLHIPITTYHSPSPFTIYHSLLRARGCSCADYDYGYVVWCRL